MTSCWGQRDVPPTPASTSQRDGGWVRYNGLNRKEDTHLSLDRDSSIIAQNAGSTAAAIYGALVKNRGDETFNPEEYEAIRLHVFSGTLELAGAETVVQQFEGGTAVDSSGPVSARPVFATNSSGGGEDGNIEVKFGKHRGKTIREIFEQDQGWLEWAAESANNDFIKQRARRFLASVA